MGGSSLTATSLPCAAVRTCCIWYVMAYSRLNAVALWHHDAMKSIAFLSQKGGSGKTTLAVHTAVAAQEAREKVFLIDTDPQKSATVWGNARAAEKPIVVTISASELDKVLRAGAEDEMSLAIIDTAPHTAPDAARIARSVDLVVIPCRPTAFDLAAVSNAVEIVRASKKKAVLVLSACPFRSPRDCRDQDGARRVRTAGVPLRYYRPPSLRPSCGHGQSSD